MRNPGSYREAGDLYALALGFRSIEVEQNVPGRIGEQPRIEHIFAQAPGSEPPTRDMQTLGMMIGLSVLRWSVLLLIIARVFIRIPLSGAIIACHRMCRLSAASSQPALPKRNAKVALLFAA